MKIRSGFVSNSSSSSFIVQACDVERAKSMGLTLISVKTLKEYNKKLTELENSKAEIMKDVPSFLGGGYNYYGSQIDILGIDNLDDADFISEPYDRDEAYRSGMDDYFSTFLSDL